MPDESNASTQSLGTSAAEGPAKSLADLKAAADSKKNGQPAASAVVEQAAPLSKVAALEERLASLESAVASLGSLHMTQTHDSLSGFRAWWEGWVQKIEKAL